MSADIPQKETEDMIKLDMEMNEYGEELERRARKGSLSPLDAALGVEFLKLYKRAEREYWQVKRVLRDGSSDPTYAAKERRYQELRAEYCAVEMAMPLTPEERGHLRQEFAEIVAPEYLDELFSWDGIPTPFEEFVNLTSKTLMKQYLAAAQACKSPALNIFEGAAAKRAHHRDLRVQIDDVIDEYLSSQTEEAQRFTARRRLAVVLKHREGPDLGARGGAHARSDGGRDRGLARPLHGWG
jgi:hypothetical protein